MAAKLLTMAAVASLLGLRTPARALRILRALEAKRSVTLVHKLGQGRQSRYFTTMVLLKKGLPDLLRGREMDRTVQEELERLRKSDVQIRARLRQLEEMIKCSAKR